MPYTIRDNSGRKIGTVTTPAEDRAAAEATVALLEAMSPAFGCLGALIGPLLFVPSIFLTGFLLAPLFLILNKGLTRILGEEVLPMFPYFSKVRDRSDLDTLTRVSLIAFEVGQILSLIVWALVAASYLSYRLNL